MTKNNNFKNYVTSTAFSLSLSRSMIESLCLLDTYGTYFVQRQTFGSLLNRGLIELDADAGSDLPETMRAQISPCVRLTEAGKAVIPLLKLSGLYIHYEKGVEILAPSLTLKGN